MKIFDYFETISSIPRGSGHEQAISDYMVDFAKQLNLEVIQDSANNVYIYKPGTKGYENSKPVILQGHLDIVWEKDKDTDFNFETQGLELYKDGDWIAAKGTTLGADNGVAIAYQMAILADNTLEHPPLEIFMTTEEETGMGGVRNMHGEYLKGRTLINLDTDYEGEFLVSCAGGVRVRINMALSAEQIGTTAAYNMKIHNLRGGHSGAEIHHERANANVIMGRVLKILNSKLSIGIACVNGGTKDNVITRECDAIITVDANKDNELKQLIAQLDAMLKSEYSAQDPDITIELTPTTTNTIINRECVNKMLNLITLLPNGVIGMSHHIENLVETSLNMGIVDTTDKNLHITFAIRSSVETKKHEMVSKIMDLCEIIGAHCEAAEDYPAWTYKEHSPLREVAIKVYEKMYDKEPVIMAIHAGLECGFISQKLPQVDIISMGPNVKDIHSPQERVSISSMTRVYEYLLELLKALN